MCVVVAAPPSGWWVVKCEVEVPAAEQYNCVASIKCHILSNHIEHKCTYMHTHSGLFSADANYTFSIS